MKKQILKGAALGFALALTITSCTNQEEQFLDIENGQLDTEELIVSQSSQIIEGSYIIVFNQKVTGDIGAKFGNDHKAARAAIKTQAEKMFIENKVGLYEISNSYSKVFNGVASKLTEEDVTRLRTDKRIAYIEKDQMVTLAPPPGKGPGNGGGGSAAQETPWGITRVNGVKGSVNGNAWIIDTGIDLDHPDLNVNASKGFNAFSSGKDGRSLDDGNGHGSHVAGTIAAIDNTIGVIGVAPGAAVIPVKVLDSRGSGSYSGVIAGIDHVAANGGNGDVANMSLGGPVSQAVDDAVFAAAQNSGVKFVLAAGNESDDANNHSPARVNGNNIYTISAMSNGDNWASFSNFGNPPIDYCAPGVSIKSTWKDGGYNTISGTSMAAPHAAGVLLLGSARASGTVNSDPDGSPDTIISH